MISTSPGTSAGARFNPFAAGPVAGLSIPDPAEIVRRADVANHVDAGLGAATAAVRGALEHLPGQRRRRSRRPFAVIGLLVGAAAGIGVLTWWTRRRAATRARDAALADATLDREALDRAAGEGMVGGRDVTDIPPLADPGTQEPRLVPDLP